MATPGALVLFFEECPGEPGALGEPVGLEIEPGALIYETGRFGTKTGWFGYEPGGLVYKTGRFGDFKTGYVILRATFKLTAKTKSP